MNKPRLSFWQIWNKSFGVIHSEEQKGLLPALALGGEAWASILPMPMHSRGTPNGRFD